MVCVFCWRHGSWVSIIQLVVLHHLYLHITQSRRICFRWVAQTEIAGLLQIVLHLGFQWGPKSWWTGQSSGTEAALLFSSDVTSAASETRLIGQVEWETVDSLSTPKTIIVASCSNYCQTVRHIQVGVRVLSWDIMVYVYLHCFSTHL